MICRPAGALALLFTCFACQPPPVSSVTSTPRPLELTFLPTAETSSEATPFSQILTAYKRRTGVSVASLPAYHSVESRLRYLQQLFTSHAPEPDMLEIDNIWTGALASNLIDLTSEFAPEAADIPADLLEPFTVNGRLLAIPLFLSTSVLYYRTDLLARYGYTHPPQTWEELATMAATIQAGERTRGKGGFWGFAWQGRAGETLTCNALEWERSEGAGIFNKSGAVDADTPAAEKALARARSWVGAISPPSVVEYDELDTDNLWLAGLAAFDRSWLSLNRASQASPETGGKFDTAPLPAGSKGRAWVYGGIGITVSKYSRHRREALQFIHYLVSRATQQKRLEAAAVIPVRASLLANPELLQDTSLSGWMGEHWQQGIFPRPARLARGKYEEVSFAYSTAVHNALSGKQTVHDSLADLQQHLQAILKR